MRRRSRCTAVIVVLCVGMVALPAAARSVELAGVVFEDLNGNGQRETDEPALEGLSVSNGVEILTTGADGAFALTAEESITGNVFVTTPSGWRASQKFFVTADFDRYAGKTQPADIGLVRDPARENDRFCFVQLTDTHVVDNDFVIRTMADDIDVVNRLTDEPLFVVTTGDLVDRGKREEELTSYLKGIARCRFPRYDVPGNHDYGGEVRSTENYEKLIGPRYYSFSIGSYHFIARDSLAPDRDEAAAARQRTWMDKDLALHAADKRVIFFQHFLPTNDELEYCARNNGAAIFSGHWHGQRERLYKGVLDVNSPPLRFGGIDRSPRGFRIIHIDGEQILCEWRVGQQQKRAEIICPAQSASAEDGEVALRVLAYDTAVRVQAVRYAVFPGSQPEGTPVASGTLRPEGSWAWAGTWKVPEDMEPGSMTIRAEVIGADGSTWSTQQVFDYTAGTSPRPRKGADWPFFHNDAGHRGYIETGPKPPLKVAWTTHVGGTIHLASPVIGDGKVFIGTGFEQSLSDCAVSAIDLATGQTLWRQNVDSPIRHCLAVWQDNVLAVTQAGTLYCFDTAGQSRWEASLARDSSMRWDTSFPVTDGQRVYAGRSQGFGAFDLATGEPVWQAKGGRDWWPNVYSGPSLGTGLLYQGGPFVRALNPANGDELWSNDKMSVSTVSIVPAVVETSEQGDSLYVFQNKKTLLCLDGRTGKTRWEGKFDPDAPVGQGELKEIVPLADETGTPAVGAQVVCVGGANVQWPGQEGVSAGMHGFDKVTGRLLWRFDVTDSVASSVPYQRNEPTITSSPVIVGDVVYFGANDGNFYALEVATGRKLWSYRFGVPVASTAAVTGNTLVVATWDGIVYALVGTDSD